MSEYIGKNLRFVLWVMFAALCFRLLLVYKLALVVGDSLVYADIARNLLHYGTFAQTTPLGEIRPTIIRLPGYPFFMAAIFRLFGEDNFRAAMLVQVVLDLGTCLLIYDVARRVFPETPRAARIALLLAAFAPFIACYTVTPLTEIPSIFFITLSLDLAIIAWDPPQQTKERLPGGADRASLGYWAGCGAALAVTIVLRPDGGLMLGSIGLVLLFRLFRGPQRTNVGMVIQAGTNGGRATTKRLVAGGLLMTAVALAPLIPWTIRNWRVLHVFQPLVTFAATDPGEFVPRGWERWLRTWTLDYSNTEDVAFRMDGETVEIDRIPGRAFDGPEERQRVADLLDQYNRVLIVTPELDRRFGELADAAIARHRFRYYVVYPALRLAGMWLRPRTELLPLNVHWWRFGEHPWSSIISVLLGLMNLLLVAAAMMGAVRGVPVRYLALLVVYPVVRSLFLLPTGSAEDRYTLECFPFVYLLAARWLATWKASRKSA